MREAERAGGWYTWKINLLELVRITIYVTPFVSFEVAEYLVDELETALSELMVSQPKETRMDLTLATRLGRFHASVLLDGEAEAFVMNATQWKRFRG